MSKDKKKKDLKLTKAEIQEAIKAKKKQFYQLIKK